MRLRYSIIGLVFFTLFISPVYSADFLRPNDPAVINKDNRLQLKDTYIKEKVIQPVDNQTRMKDTLDKNQKDNDSSKTIQGNLTYNPEFTLKRVIFKGNTKISSRELSKLSKDLINKEIYLDDVMDLTIKVSRYYQSKGYITSYAYLPEQEIENGNVTICIKESKITKKEVEGNRWGKNWYFNNVVMYGLPEGKIFNAKNLQGTMKDINNKPNMKAAASLTKNNEHNTEIKLHVQDRFPLLMNVAWDDFGRDYTGRQRFTGILGIDNLTGFGDKIYGGAILSSRSTGALAGYSIPISKYGTRLSFDYSYSDVSIGGPYKSLGITGKASNYSVRITQPLRNTATQDIATFISVDAVNSTSRSKLFKTNLSDYELRILRTGINGMFDDSRGRTIASLGVDLGTSGLGASQNIKHGQQSTFYKITASLARVQRLPKKCLGIIKIFGQYSPQSLYSAEQMYLGGVYSVRGYQPSELLGDYGVVGTAELRMPIPGLERILPAKIKNWSNNIKLATFYDWGYVKEHNHLYGYPTNFIHSVGFGTYINLTENVYIQLGVGFPLGKKQLNEHSGRFYFAINTDLDRILLKNRERL